MAKKIMFFAINFILAGLFTPAFGAQARTITISEGIQMVLKDSRLIKISLNDQDMAFQDTLFARSALLPQLNASVIKSYFKNQPEAKLDSIVAPTGEKEPLSFGFDVYQTLFDFGKSLSNYKAAKELLSARKESINGIKRVAVLEFITAYFDLLEAEKLVDVAEKEVESISSYLNDVQHLYEQGSVVKNDLLPAKVRLADAKQKLISAKNSKEVALTRLNNILSLPLRKQISVQDIETHLPQFPGLEAAWKTAELQRPEIAFFQDQIKASSFSEKAKQVENFPVVFADGGYTYTQNKYVVHQDTTFVELGAKANLYDGGAARAELFKERARQNQLKEQKDKLVEDIKFEVEDSFSGLRDSSEKVLVAKDALAEAKENVRVYRLRYTEGSATSTEVLEAITLQTRAQTNYHTADYEVKRNYAKLMYAMGIDLSLIYEKMENKNEPGK